MVLIFLWKTWFHNWLYFLPNLLTYLCTVLKPYSPAWILISPPGKRCVFSDTRGQQNEVKNCFMFKRVLRIHKDFFWIRIRILVSIIFELWFRIYPLHFCGRWQIILSYLALRNSKTYICLKYVVIKFINLLFNVNQKLYSKLKNCQCCGFGSGIFLPLDPERRSIFSGSRIQIPYF